MKHVITLLAILAFLATVPGCDVGGGRGPTAEQLAEAQTIEQEFAPLRQEAQDLIRQHEGSTDQEVVAAVMSLQSTLNSTRSDIEALRTAPRDLWNEYKSSAEAAVQVLRLELEEAKQHF